MPNRVQTYVLAEKIDPRARQGAQRINRKDAKTWNEKGYGVFHTIQEFKGPRRVENLVHINAWAVDIDEGTKPQMIDRINMGLLPTMTVETKKGFHVYWSAKDATKENYKNIVAMRLVPFYNADKKAKDLCRILRTPGYFHLKDVNDPFLIKKIHDAAVQYTEYEMFKFYKDVLTPKTQNTTHKKTIREFPGADSFWENVWNLNCEQALLQLSGSDYVNGEQYSFNQNSNGTQNIYVNNQGTSCWIDCDGRIGSADGGGPTIFQWLNWFHKDGKKVIEIIKKEFPQCSTTQLSLL